MIKCPKPLKHPASAVLTFLALTVSPAFATGDDSTPQGVFDSSHPRCINSDMIQGYKILDDKNIRFLMKGDFNVAVALQSVCHDLKFHNYTAFTPSVNRLCVKTDTVRTRSGLKCPIKSFTLEPKTKILPPEKKQ